MPIPAVAILIDSDDTSILVENDLGEGWLADGYGDFYPYASSGIYLFETPEYGNDKMLVWNSTALPNSTANDPTNDYLWLQTNVTCKCAIHHDHSTEANKNLRQLFKLRLRLEWRTTNVGDSIRPPPLPRRNERMRPPTLVPHEFLLPQQLQPPDNLHRRQLAQHPSTNRLPSLLQQSL